MWNLHPDYKITHFKFVKVQKSLEFWSPHFWYFLGEALEEDDFDEEDEEEEDGEEGEEEEDDPDFDPSKAKQQQECKQQ